jgi:phage terminase large subunit
MIKNLEVAPKLLHWFDESDNRYYKRYLVAYGGRASSKSWHAIRAVLLRATKEKKLVLCVREIQNSIADSVHRLISDQIRILGLEWFYDIQATTIRGKNGSEFIYKGVRSNPDSIKSTEGVDICLVEEAHSISQNSWEVLEPTIRKKGSQFFIVFNPDHVTDPTSQKFIENPPENADVTQINFTDNPWFSEESRMDMEYKKRVDYEGYLHVWMGHYKKHSDAVIFKGKYTEEPFTPEPHWDGAYYGADWGFSTDPTVLVKLWVNDRKLYVEHEAWGVGVELDHLPDMFDNVPDARKSVIRADNARPETISHLRRKGYNRMVSCKKWKGSVEDGIEFLLSFEQIIIHPRCKHTLEEAGSYSYKENKGGDILAQIEDKNNHCFDAIRYALEPLIAKKTTGSIGRVAGLA